MTWTASEITGNQELPKVLYIVPWQKSEAGELVGKPVNTLLDEVLAPIDRSEFLRQVDYYGDLYRRGRRVVRGIRVNVDCRRGEIKWMLLGGIVRFFQEGGAFMYPILSYSRWVLAIAVERWMYLTTWQERSLTARSGRKSCRS